jgi:putative radical SAM enzyme (TIGR03279 family)
MHNNPGPEIERVLPDSLAHAAGIVPGDIILSVNGHKVCDLIDFMFFRNEEKLHVIIQRKDKRLSFPLLFKPGQDIGIELKPFKIKTCTNRCIFCFVHQLPKGLRKTLYVKDEDYRMSFLYGNYVTLTNLSTQDKKRIVQQKLSPLYLSVHSTNATVRTTLLGNPKAPDILKEIAFFKEHKIRMHCQVVLCPGYNDGRDLEKTIRDLYKFYPYVLSIAIVPVGLTSHRRSGQKLRPVEKDDALRALSQVDSFQKRFRKKHGDSVVYASDELYIKAETEFPSLREYGDLPQIENGVGMIPQFMHYAKRVKIPQSGTKKRFITFTGVSFYPYLTKFIEKLKKSGTDIEAVPVENTFFGKSITVTGLLTGRDVIRTLQEYIKKDDLLLIPDVVMKEGEEVFLDDISRRDLEDLLAVATVVVEPTAKGLLDAIAPFS